MKINDNFRLICTSNYERINQMSPAFVNRFEVIVLEDQLTDLDDNKFKELINFEFNYFQKELYLNFEYKNEIDEENIKKKEKHHIHKQEEENNESDEEIEEIGKIVNKNKIINRQSIIDDIETNFEEDLELTDMVYGKIKILRQYQKKIDMNEDIEIDENSKKYLTFTSLAKFCRTIIIFFNKFKNKKINKKNIVNFSFELLFEDELSENNKDIQNILLDELIKANTKINWKKFENEERYFFENSESLKKLMIYLYASSLVNQYLCIIGPPGIGKTLGTRAFSLIREIIFKRKYDTPFYMHTFNEYTRPSDYLGVSSMKDDKLIFKNGTLTKSLMQGNVFIADEFNISSDDCMKSIFPALELNFSKDMIFPGIEGKIQIDPDFFFVICQNTKEILGRKELPDKIKNKIKTIYYPKRILEEIEKICISIYEDFHFEKKINEKDAKLCGDLLMKINQNQLLTPLSLRDIYKLFSRISS